MISMRTTAAALVLPFLFLCACRSAEKPPPKPLSTEEQIGYNIDSLKRTAANGDLIVRLGDDLISYQIKFLNETDRSYSHAGMIREQNGRKWVVHITPEGGEGDTIQLTPIDSFITPGRNLKCALYRYQLSAAEKDSVNALIDGYRARHVHFDRLYDLATDNRLYCSEMISKALHQATGGRLSFKTFSAPPNMVPLLVSYFQPEHVSRDIIVHRKFVTIDNLYRQPGCALVMQFPLKFFPGNEQH